MTFSVPTIASLMLLATSGATLSDGITAYENEQYADAHEILEPLANEGHWEAQHLLALMHTFGQHVEQDDAIAARWFDRSSTMLQSAAREGDPAAQYHVGVYYKYGLGGLQQDEETAEQWIESAMEAGYQLDGASD